jgi:hypothetical protein
MKVARRSYPLGEAGGGGDQTDGLRNAFPQPISMAITKGSLTKIAWLGIIQLISFPTNYSLISPIRNNATGPLPKRSLEPFSSDERSGGIFMRSSRFERKGFFGLLFLLVLCPSAARADAILLKNGNRIEAERVWEENGEYKCDQYGGVVGFPKGEVLRVEQQQDNGEPRGVQTKGLSSGRDGANPRKTILSEVRELYLELMSFKNDAQFHKVGFASENKYSDWLDRVGKLTEDPRSKDLLKKGVPVQDLLNLGFEYFKSGGKETPFSRFANGEFRKAFAR